MVLAGLLGGVGIRTESVVFRYNIWGLVRDSSPSAEVPTVSSNSGAGK